MKLGGLIQALQMEDTFFLFCPLLFVSFGNFWCTQIEILPCPPFIHCLYHIGIDRETNQGNSGHKMEVTVNGA